MNQNSRLKGQVGIREVFLFVFVLGGKIHFKLFLALMIHGRKELLCTSAMEEKQLKHRERAISEDLLSSRSSLKCFASMNSTFRLMLCDRNDFPQFGDEDPDGQKGLRSMARLAG